MNIIPDAAQNFVCYLIDNCEGETITEESLRTWLGRFGESPRYNPAPPPASTNGLTDARIDWIANVHCPGGIAYPSNVKNAIREALLEAASEQKLTDEQIDELRVAVRAIIAATAGK